MCGTCWSKRKTWPRCACARSGKAPTSRSWRQASATARPHGQREERCGPFVQWGAVFGCVSFPTRIKGYRMLWRRVLQLECLCFALRNNPGARFAEGFGRGKRALVRRPIVYCTWARAGAWACVRCARARRNNNRMALLSSRMRFELVLFSCYRMPADLSRATPRMRGRGRTKQAL